MKKYIKYAVAFSMLVCLIFAFSSCNKLDDMRNHQGVIKDNGALLVVGDVEYVPLPELESGYDWNFEYGGVELNECYITKEDVPVLLSQFLGNIGDFINQDDIVLFRGNRYVKKDKYDEYMSKLDYEDFEHYSFLYPEYDEESHTYTEKLYTLSEKEKAAVDSAISDGNTVPPEIMNNITVSYTRSCYQSNKDGSIIKRQYEEGIFDGIYSRDSYYASDIFEILVIYEKSNKSILIQKYDTFYKPSSESEEILLEMVSNTGMEDEYSQYYYADEFGYYGADSAVETPNSGI